MRKKALTENERVFDDEKRLYGHIIAIDGNKVKIAMDASDIILNHHFFGFNGKPYSRSTIWETETPETLYQEAVNKIGPDGNPVFYEHNEMEYGYCYYSPTMDENLFTMEVTDRAFWVVIRRITECGDQKEFAIRKDIDAAKTLKNALKNKFFDNNKTYTYDITDDELHFNAHLNCEIDEVDIELVPFEDMEDEAFVDIMLAKGML